MPVLRPYQATLKADVKEAWAKGAKNVLMRLDTGGGKTSIVSEIHKEHVGASAVIAHRQELVGQLSLRLAGDGVRHNIVAPDKVRRAIVALHLAELGQSYFHPGSRCSVAGVDTLIRAEGLEAWNQQVTLWTVDEAHHVVEDNKWHTCLSRFTHPDCLGLGPSATPKRADGKGLGAHADGVFNALIEGPPMRWLINQGWLTDYEMAFPESDLQMINDVGSTGDWSPHQLKEAASRSHIVGDVVEQYLRLAPGRLGITFATDVETAEKMTQRYRAAGVRAETLTGKTDDGYRRQILKQFAARQIDQLVAVDIVSEGFDLPAIEVASLARPTASLALYMQQFGRALRPMPGKDKALIIDHVNNMGRHGGPPDLPRVWTLDRREGRGGSSDAIPTRVCTGCYKPYERFYNSCPFCGAEVPTPEPGGRGSPQEVEGDLVLLSAEALAKLRGEVLQAQITPQEYGRWLIDQGVNSDLHYRGHLNKFVAKQTAHAELRGAMTEFTRGQLARGLRAREVHKLFWMIFGVDVLTAQTLSKTDAEALTKRIMEQL